MKRRLLAALLTVCMLAGLLSPSVSAASLSEADQKAIDSLLSWYEWFGADYNCTEAAAAFGSDWHANLLMGIVCHPSCVDFELYSADYQEVWGTRDPQGRWDSYSRIAASEAEWILKNIFHCSQSDISAMRDALTEFKHVYYLDGYYYGQLLGVGDGFYTKNMEVSRYGERYLVRFQMYEWPADYYMYTKYAVVGKSRLGGKSYWTLCYLGDESPSVTGFLDVNDEAYYAPSVSWAVENDITTGVSDCAFAPDQACTRAQAVTFLWRAAGMPKPSETACPFKDVSKKAFYYKAMLWAIENGITNGLSETRFGPDETCTRAQIVTFLYRAAGSPGHLEGGSFSDVPQGSYYETPVSWAVENKITTGTSKETFSPNDSCTRAQMVTFLQRFLSESEIQFLPTQWIGSYYADTGEHIDVEEVTMRTVTLTHWVLTEQGDTMVSNTFTLRFTDPEKTRVTRPYMTSNPSLEYIYTYTDRTIVLSESFSDRTKIFSRRE